MDGPIATKFVTHDITPLETYVNTTPYRLMVKLRGGEKLTREEKNELFRLASEYHGYHHLMGWSYNFCPFLKRYWVKDDWGSIYEYRAPDKTSIRANLLGVAEIVEVQ